MTRKSLITIVLMVSAVALRVDAQTNLQVFYDFGSDRKHVTTTLEGFYNDKWGNTFFFIDHDFKSEENDGAPSGTYMEIARCLNFWQKTKLAPLSFHVEFNAGEYRNYNIPAAWLFGVDYFLHSKDFKNTLNLKALYKTIAHNDPEVPMQFTVVWGMHDLVGVKGLSFTGFADFWWEDHIAIKDNGEIVNKKNVFVTEPQLWYQVGRHFGVEQLNVGTEIEISNDFGTTDGFKVRPCLGAKWVF